MRSRIPFLGEAWITTTYEATATVLRDHDHFVVNPANAGRKSYSEQYRWMPRSFRSLTSHMLIQDEPDHRRLRSLVDQAFQRRQVDQMRPQIEAIVDRSLDQVETQSRGGQRSVDLIRHFAKPVPLTVISELLGLPEQDRGRFGRWATSFTSIEGSWDVLRLIPAMIRIRSYLKRQIQVCQLDPRPGLLHELVTAEHVGKPLTEDELIAMIFLLLIAGHETTVHLISHGLLTLLEHPEQKQALAAD